MRSGITEADETNAHHTIRAIRHDESHKAAVSFSARMHSITSPPFQPNTIHMACMGSNETCTCCGRNSLAAVVSDVEPVNGAAPERRTEYPPRWGRMSKWVRGRAGWRCELCRVRNGPPPNLLTVHHLDGNKWNLLPWNLAALCQNCHRQVQWTLDLSF